MLNAGISAAEHEDPDFVEINSETVGLDGQSEETFGPLAILLIGYIPREVDLVKEYLHEIEADMVKVIVCTDQLAEQRLCDVLESASQPHPKKQLSFQDVDSAPQTARRMLIMSGMTSDEVLSIVYGYRQQELPETVMAAAVPASYERKVSALVDDVYGDHEYMMAKEKAASA
ncbi:hypothetical protein WJX73_003434 [Symbiochloris irregularis]|uniref:Uncharacterized protein n=1 Tax=Symbiochloris irregularis TaxID=706552 RepID=A0AAW1NU34_9CHLO